MIEVRGGGLRNVRSYFNLPANVQWRRARRRGKPKIISLAVWRRRRRSLAPAARAPKWEGALVKRLAVRVPILPVCHKSNPSERASGVHLALKCRKWLALAYGVHRE